MHRIGKERQRRNSGRREGRPAGGVWQTKVACPLFRIREAAKRAVGLKGRIQPLSFGSPVEVVLTYKHTEHADAASGPAACLELERVDGYTVRYRFREFADWYGGVW